MRARSDESRPGVVFPGSGLPDGYHPHEVSMPVPAPPVAVNAAALDRIAYAAVLEAHPAKERVLPGLRVEQVLPLSVRVWRDVDQVRRDNPMSGGRTLYKVILPNGWDSDVIVNGHPFLAVDALAVRLEW